MKKVICFLIGVALSACASSAGAPVDVADVQPFSVGSFRDNDVETDYIVYTRDGRPWRVIEHHDFGDRGQGWTVYEFNGTDLHRYHAWSRIFAKNDARSDGWYEQSYDFEFHGKEIVHARKTLNGKPTEPDEHELRAAFSSGQRLFERLSEE
ncbi:hypothetical protein [Hyphococcus lacteus]|uniref:Lipoprotein n=1 Tax=Hyphococcus lacteus TaxID=3143536 RepID=A0ABV3Z6T6_9PROT